MSSETVAKSVGKKLRYYFEVKRLEDGFDISGVNAPQLNHPPLKSIHQLPFSPRPKLIGWPIPPSPYKEILVRASSSEPAVNHYTISKRATLQYDGLHDRALKHYFHQNEVKTRITQMHPGDHPDMREEDVRRLLKRYMYKHRFISSREPPDYRALVHQPQKIVGYNLNIVNTATSSYGNRTQACHQDNKKHNKHPTMPQWMYKHHPTKGNVLKPEFVGFGVGLKSQKHKSLKGGYPLLRTVPSQKVSKGEAHRLIDVATKILVATEKVNELQSRSTTPNQRRQTAPTPFETDKPLPEYRGGKKTKRPSTAKYTWDIHGRRHQRVKEYESRSDDGGRRRPLSEKRRQHMKKVQSYDDSFIPDWIMRQQSDRPKTPEPKPSPRPKSAKYRVRDVITPPPKATVINVPETRVERDVTVNNETQTADTVGIQTERRLIEDYDPDRKMGNANKKVKCVKFKKEDLVKDGPWAEYQVYVRTGDRVGAATRADVRITLYGDKGRSQELTLDKSSRNKIRFQRGKEDVFLVPHHHVGKLYKIKIGHDRKDLNYAWYLDGVSVYDMHTRRIYDFQCDAWLSAQDGDKKTYRDLPLDSERAFVEAYDDARQRRGSPRAGKKKDDQSSESHASKDDKRSIEEVHGSRGDRHSDSDSSTTSYSSSSTSSSSSSDRRKNRKGRGRKSVSPAPRSKTPEKVRELSPVRKAQQDDFFDKRSGPTFTFRSYSDDGSKTQEEYVTGYKAGLEAASSEKKHQHEEEDQERKRVLVGPSIHDAARSGNMERMQQLISYYPEMKESKDETGLTPLHIASQQGRLDIVKWLTASNINLNTETQTGYTAIHLTAMNGHLNCMIVLAAMGATLTCRSVDRQTPLHVAAMNGHLECVKWLIANRSSLEAEDQLGRTALDLAKEYQHKTVENFIRKCLEESDDPNSSLHALRSSSGSKKGLTTIQEDNRRDRNQDRQWHNDTRPGSARATAGSTDEGRKSQPSNLKEKRRVYEEQHRRMENTGTSFLDSIRNEVD